MSHEFESLCKVEPGDSGVVDAASDVAREVLETMFFAEALPSGCGHDWLSSALSDRIAFEGSHSGEMRLSISLEAATTLACAFLGVDPPELTEPLRAQVILELTNILCGAIMSRLWPESKLALTPPEAAIDQQSVGAAWHRCFDLPEGNLSLWLECREAASVQS